MLSSEEHRECRDCGRVMPVSKFKAISRKGTMWRRHICTRCYDIKHRYGITGQEFFRMLEEQLYCCLICENPIDDSTAHVDHCHVNKNVRSLLCRNCNLAIGQLKHDKEIAQRVFEYLNKHIDEDDLRETDL